MSNDRPLQVGDLVVGVGFKHDIDLIGMEGQIVGGLEVRECKLLATGEIVTRPSYLVAWAHSQTRGNIAPENLRLKRPPSSDKSEPRTDFIPCEPEFLEWMKNRGRVGA
jgi:hypothetical protein